MQTESQTCLGDLSEAECAGRLAGMFSAADVHAHWPMDTEEVSEVLRAGGAYDVTTELLDSWARSQSVESVFTPADSHGLRAL